MKLIIRLALLLICSYSFSQTNLLDTSTWTAGTGSVSGFTRRGIDAENIREMGVDPHGNSALLWKGITDATVTNDDGGWSTNIVINPSKTYRCTVWMKKTNSNDGYVYFGVRAKDSSGGWALSDLSNTTTQTYAAFHNGGLPILDNWYLFVGYIHNNSYTSTTSIGGLYDVGTGNKVKDFIDRKFQSTASQLTNVSMLHRGVPNLADALFFYNPTIYEVNGQEPTIQELINAQPNQQNPSGSSGNWSLNNQDVYYNDGDVGIGTDTPDEKLAVNGTIHAQKVRVDLNNWPDYVFAKKYNLPSLEDVEKYIKEKGHLQNIPSAKEVQKNGIFLGEMNAKLLEKIEELTLYIIEQEKRIDQLEKRD